jgi:serine protease
MQSAIDTARNKNAVVVVAAGNDSDEVAYYSPASCAGVIPVSAVGRSGTLAYYSNHGNKIQISAPGGDMSAAVEDGVLSTINAGQQGPGADTYAWYQGTSMATPHIAGVAALMLSRNPSLTAAQLLARMRSTAKLFVEGCTGCGAGVVDAYRSTLMANATVVKEVEGNDTRGTAQALAATYTVVNGVMLSSSDVDYYKVSLAAGRSLRMSVAPTLTTRDYDVQLQDSAGNVLAYSARPYGQVDRIDYTNRGDVTVALYIKVYSFGAEGGAYTMSVMR